MKKNDRLELIRKIVQENKITTQGELVKLLQNVHHGWLRLGAGRDLRQRRGGRHIKCRKSTEIV